MAPPRKTWETTDLGAAAYALLKGLEVIKARSDSRARRGRFLYVFSDPDLVGEDLKLEFANHDLQRFDTAVKAMKKLCCDEGSRGYVDLNKLEGPGTWETSDMGVAAYARFKGFQLLGTKSNSLSGRNGQAVFVFRDPDQTAASLKVDYVNSECRRFDAAVRSLKKLTRDDSRRRAAWPN